MKLTVKVDARNAVGKISRLQFTVRDRVRNEIASITDDLETRVRQKLSGEVLNIRTGALIGSIHSEVSDDGYSGTVYSDGSVPYAAIHEYGGVINHPGSDKLQVFQAADKLVFTHYTRPHPIPIPERSYLRSSLTEMHDQIVSRLTSAVQSAADEANA